MNRREFLRRAALVGGTTILTACGGQPDRVAQTPPTARPSPSPTVRGTTVAPLATVTRVPQPTSSPTRMIIDPSSTPTSTPVPTWTPTAQVASDSELGTVALVKTTDRAEGLRRAVELLGVNPVRGKKVLLKPNFNSADPAPGSTHPDTLRALVTQLQEMGAGVITVGDRSGMGNTRRVMQQLGALDMAKELGFETVVFDDLDEGEWAMVQSKDNHWKRGFAVPKMLLNSEAVVQTCNLKTHRFGGHFTLSLKNSVGFVAKQIGGTGYNYMTELHGTADQRAMIAEINRTYAPALIVMDGIEAFTTGGPDRGNVVRPEVILAGRDRIALDAVGVAILRLFGTTPQVSNGRVFEQAQIARAVELELGARGPQDIHILTGDADSEAFAKEIQPLIT